MPCHSTTIPLQLAHDADAPPPPRPPRPPRPPPARRTRRSSIAPPDSLLAQPASRPSRAQRKAAQLAEALASSSPLPPPPQMRDVGALVRTPGNEKKKKKKKENAPAEKKIDPPRRTSCEIEDLFARLELLPTSSPLPARPRIRREEELAVAAEELRKEKAAAAADKDKAARRLRPALTDKARNASTEGKKVLRVHVQTKAQRLDLGARGRAVAAELERRKAVPATPPRPRRRLLDESLLTPTPAPSSSFDLNVD